MDCTFAAVGPMVAIGTNPSLGILDVFGSTIAAGVIGTVIAVIGLSLMGVGNPEYGNPVYLLLSLVVLSLILLINKFVRGFIANISVLLGIVAGFVIAAMLSRVNLDGVAHAPWVGIVLPFHFGMPHFDPLLIRWSSSCS